MSPLVDLGDATATMRRLLAEVPTDALDGPTPCPDYRLGDLIDHVHGFTQAFTAVAERRQVPIGGGSGDAARLPDGWSDDLPIQLTDLAAVWREPSAWTGSTRAAGIELPNQVWGLVALNELVVHGWDIAAATGRPFEATAADLAACTGFLAQDADHRPAGGPFGPPVPVSEGASEVDRLIALSGRDPGWAPTR